LEGIVPRHGPNEGKFRPAEEGVRPLWGPTFTEKKPESVGKVAAKGGTRKPVSFQKKITGDEKPASIRGGGPLRGKSGGPGGRPWRKALSSTKKS